MCEINSIEDINFNELWMKTKQNSSHGKEHKSCSMIWHDKDRAKKYDERVKENNRKRAMQQIEKLKINSKSSVLDIGAGPGTLAIPLAKSVKKITAIEPARGMFEYLKQNIEEENLNNITCINKNWEEVNVDEIEKHDVVIASFSLGMLDLREALKKMNDAANESVYIFHFAGITQWERRYKEIWRRLGREYIPGPKSDYIYNILYQMGIYANIEVNETDYNQKFKNLTEAANEFKQMLDIETPEEDEILREYLSENLVKENGNLVSKGKTMRAMIWWEKGKRCDENEK
ncbi:MAG: class I SAM-dependent methyltransferase [Candidatus Altiarchaeales archaeon HGW-Altiarchaeales-3]|nr:MAG: class I SAM-dependent methyltransferase [Candidatus Altiarchaeales archaeon HGW-Altiarchaeales-3]